MKNIILYKFLKGDGLMPSSLFRINISETQQIPIVVGNTTSFDISIQNISMQQRLYNLRLSLTLPDGMVLYTATEDQTSSVINKESSITYKWTNIKDLAPMEIDFKFSITVKCNTKFKNNTVVPFGYQFSDIQVECQVDTMPRGSADVGNEVLTQMIDMTYTTVRFKGAIITTGKVLKGAGSTPDLRDYTQVYTATCKFINNAVAPSFVNITLLLEDGIRYIGNMTVTGTDGAQFTSPTISLVSIEGKVYMQLYYGNMNLSINSSTTVTFSYAIWNRYYSNQGGLIIHGTRLNMLLHMVSADPLTIASSSSSTSFLAMDLIITTSISKTTIDVQNNVTYTYSYRVGQYYNVQGLIVQYFLPDGISYLSTSSSPFSVIDDPNLQGYLITYHLPLATMNSSHTVTISARIDSYYRYKQDSQTMYLPVVAADSFTAEGDILGNLVELLTDVTDSANVSSTIGIGSISKTFVQGYYKDGTPKSINVLAPLDLAEYSLTYNADTLQAIQKEVYIDDFFPLSADPINALSYSYTGIRPILPPQPISPHGVDFKYGDIAGFSAGTIQFKVPIATLGTPTQNINLMKLKGINTYGNAYSERSQVTINIGRPNLSLTKSVSGPNKSAIQVGEIYTYTVRISNSSNLETETDAFDFMLNDTLSDWFSLDASSLMVSGTGSYEVPTIEGNNIVLIIKQLAPGTTLTLTYKVTISSTLAPGVSIITTATNTNPYSQIYDVGGNNFQYSNLTKTASITISSKAITLVKSNVSGIFKVGSLITYRLTVTVPQGTIAYGLYVRDNLPSGGQVYVGPAYRNNIEVIPSISSNVVTFQAEGKVDARLQAQTITYLLTAQVINANKVVNGITSTQTDTMQCIYQQVEEGSLTTLSKNLTLTIRHPNLLMNLSATDQTTSTIYTSTATISLSSMVQFKLIFQNNSDISLKNGRLEIPIESHFIFASINTTVLCIASYDESSNKIVITIPELGPTLIGYMSFTVLPESTLKVGTSINTQATAIYYYNDLSPIKVYSGEKSNVINCLLLPGVALRPNPLYQINETTSFNVTPPGNTAIILNYFKNIGNGYDDFILIIQKVGIGYSLYIDDIKIGDILANTLYQAELPEMTHLAPNTDKVIKIVARIPDIDSLGVRYDFSVTVQSKTSPYPAKTVLNIDPHPF